MGTKSSKRSEHEPPRAMAEWGWRYHHLGIPTTLKGANETYLPEFGFYCSGFPESPFGVEWMRFDQDSPIHPLIQKVPHLAFEVDDLDEELKKHDFNIITPPNAPMYGVRVAMIEYDGAPIELMEFNSK